MYRCVHVCVACVPVSTCTCRSVTREGERTTVRLGFHLLSSKSLSFLSFAGSYSRLAGLWASGQCPSLPPIVRAMGLQPVCWHTQPRHGGPSSGGVIRPLWQIFHSLNHLSGHVLCFWDRVLLHSLGQPGTLDPPASDFWLPGLEKNIPTSSWQFKFVSAFTPLPFCVFQYTFASLSAIFCLFTFGNFTVSK